MSGGHFNYDQYKIEDMYQDVRDLINLNNTPDEFGYCSNYPEHIIMEFKEAAKALKRAAIFVNRIDWLVSGDDGEESFMSRLYDELQQTQEEE